MEKHPLISVIMPCHIQTDYFTKLPNGKVIESAKNKPEKFKRAIKSFLRQTYPNKELIVVSDGCDLCINILNQLPYCLFVGTEIKTIKLEKQADFSGKVRQAGIGISKGEIITYLDADDYIGNNHLQCIIKGFKNEENLWVWYNDYKPESDGSHSIRKSYLMRGGIGTSQFSHKKDIDLIWHSGYGHDWFTIESIMGLPNEKINTPEYYVCHYNNVDL